MASAVCAFLTTPCAALCSLWGFYAGACVNTRMHVKYDESWCLYNNSERCFSASISDQKPSSPLELRLHLTANFLCLSRPPPPWKALIIFREKDTCDYYDYYFYVSFRMGSNIFCERGVATWQICYVGTSLYRLHCTENDITRAYGQIVWHDQIHKIGEPWSVITRVLRHRDANFYSTTKGVYHAK